MCGLLPVMAEGSWRMIEKTKVCVNANKIQNEEEPERCGDCIGRAQGRGS